MNNISNLKSQISNLVKHPLFSGSAVMIIGSNAVSFLNYLYHLVMGRMLGPANYGELAALISLVGLLSVIPSAISLVIIKYISSAKDELEEAALINWLKTKVFIFSLIFTLLLLIFTPLISSFLHITKITYILIISASFLFSLQASTNRSILQGLLKFKEMVGSQFLEILSKLLISILLIYFGFRVGGAITAFFLSIVFGWYITNFFLKYSTDQKKAININYKKILSYTIPVLIQSISITSLYSADVILVKHFFLPHDAGIYAALSTLGKIVFFGTGPISSVMFPLVSKRKAKGESYKKVFLYSFSATVVLSAFLLLFYWLFPSLAINLLFGTKYLEASKLLVWFGIFMSLFTLSALLINFGLSLGRTSIVILPALAAIAQVILVWFFHQTLFTVIIVSILTTALLLVSLLIYSTLYGRKIHL